MLNPSIRRSGAVFAAAGVAAALVLAAAAPAAAAPAPLRYDIEPGSPVLISEIANGGQRDGDTQASRLSARNFIEITNYGDAPVDITGYRIYRCGGTGASYGPQAIAAEGTVLQPGEQYTTAGEGSGYDVDNIHSTNLAGYNYGAILEDASGQRVDAIGFYHEDVNNDCDVEGEWLQD
ncbi:MAG TPA: lamin tail domain-containing protein, partial [Candidatus Ruania gallistercoris]|nr:lamin tail domain-containing protein [Candidatus Ruania gallistercoris]